MIDLHAHVLPGLDDGPPDLETAVAMASAAVAAGTRILAATPHIDHRHRVRPEALAGARAVLQQELLDRKVDLRLVPGGEIAIDRLVDLADAELDLLTLGQGRWLLLETPFLPGIAVAPAIDRLQVRGYRVLLAHPERSPQFMGDVERLMPLVERGARTQITAGALDGAFGARSRRTAEAMLEQGLAHMVASDGHGPDGRRPDPLAGADAMGKRYGNVRRALRALTEDNPWAILQGDDVPQAGPMLVPVRRRLRRRVG